MKKVLSCYYVHKSNYMELADAIRNTDDHLGVAIIVAQANKYFPSYQVIKYDKSKHTVSLIESPNWNTANEPFVGDSIVHNLETGECKLVKGRKKNYQIYHSKELFVSPEYTGFDVKKAEERTKQWNAIPNLDKSRIGNYDFWVKVLEENGIEI